MFLISHRINRIVDIVNTNPEHGIEIDIRDNGKKLIVVHDPLQKGIELTKFLKYFKHAFLIANIKSERIEEEVIKVLKRYKIKNYFFLDSSFPQIINLIKKGHSKIAIRVSYYEGLETAKKLKKKVKWIWYDTFYGLPKNFKDFEKLKNYGYKICLVSPELHGKSLDANSKFLKKLKNKNLIDAVCTKDKFFYKWIN